MMLPDTEGPTPCECLIFILQNGKTNRNSKKQYMGGIRHRDVRLCTISALAQMLFWRWKCGGEVIPDFRTRRQWYNRKLIIGQVSQPESEISYATQLEHINNVFNAVGVESTTKTQAMRGCGARQAELHGVAQSQVIPSFFHLLIYEANFQLFVQIARAGRWQSGAMTGAYLTVLTYLPLKFLRRVAGFSPAGGTFHLPRAIEDPPLELQQQIWPFLEELVERHRKQKDGHDWYAGGMDQSDIQRQNFVKMLLRLRVILLQDLAVLQSEYPQYILFTAQAFATEEWKVYTERVRAGCEGSSIAPTKNLLLEQAVPEIASTLVAGTQAIVAQNKHFYQSLSNQIARVDANVNSITSGQVVIDLSLLRGSSGTLSTPSNPGPSTTPAAEPSNSLNPNVTFPAQMALSSSPPSGIEIQSGGPPSYRFANNRTVSDLWREWTIGLCGNPSIQALEERWGHKWRKEQSQRAFFSRRKFIIDNIRDWKNSRNIAEEEAVLAMERHSTLR